jgi:hypothetical protein
VLLHVSDFNVGYFTVFVTDARGIKMIYVKRFPQCKQIFGNEQILPCDTGA